MSERSDRRVQFDAIDSHEDLIAWSRRYCRRAVAVHDVAVDLDGVEWTVTTRARRRAAAVKAPRIEDASVGEPYDWEADWDDGTPSVQRRGGHRESPDDAGVVGTDRREGDASHAVSERRRDAPDGGPPACELWLSWGAFEAFDRGEWRDTLRHELIHVEQYQQFGTTDHGPEFRDRAEELDAAINCRRFADARYLLHCEECDSVVARRYRASKLVKKADQYRSNCCGAALSCVEQ